MSHSIEEPVIVNRCGYAQFMARVLKLSELTLQRLSQRVNVPISVFYPRPKRQITETELLAILDEIYSLTKNECLGLVCGSQFYQSIHGPIGRLFSTAPDLVSAIHLPEAFPFDSIFSFSSCELSKTEGYLELRYQHNIPTKPYLQRILNEVTSLVLQQSVEKFLDQKLTGAQFWFDLAAPDYHEDYTNYFHSPVSFDQPYCAIRIPAQLAETKPAHRDYAQYRVAETICHALIHENNEASGDIVIDVLHILLNRNGVASEQEVAAALYISRRTLHRRLLAKNTKFRQLKDQLASELAAQYLADSSLTVDSIANLLGYSDAANFRRAFDRWHGTTPKLFREKLLRV